MTLCNVIKVWHCIKWFSLQKYGVVQLFVLTYVNKSDDLESSGLDIATFYYFAVRITHWNICIIFENDIGDFTSMLYKLSTIVHLYIEFSLARH